MPKSRNRKNHKKKVKARNQRLATQKKQMMEQVEELKQKYTEEMAQKAKASDEGGEVSFTLDDE